MAAAMRITRRDWVFIAIVGALLALLLVNSFKDKPKSVPDDGKHRPFIEALARGEQREAVEKRCVRCHNTGALPLPSKHPPKEQCLICHAGKI